MLYVPLQCNVTMLQYYNAMLGVAGLMDECIVKRFFSFLSSLIHTFHNNIGNPKQPSTPCDNDKCEVVEGHGGGLHQLAHQHREHLGPQRTRDDEHSADLENICI